MESRNLAEKRDLPLLRSSAILETKNMGLFSRGQSHLVAATDVESQGEQQFDLNGAGLKGQSERHTRGR